MDVGSTPTWCAILWKVNQPERWGCLLNRATHLISAVTVQVRCLPPFSIIGSDLEWIEVSLQT
jgi:hypothetical protein